jgi:hypothetical protein
MGMSVSVGVGASVVKLSTTAITGTSISTRATSRAESRTRWHAWGPRRMWRGRRMRVSKRDAPEVIIAVARLQLVLARGRPSLLCFARQF